MKKQLYILRWKQTQQKPAFSLPESIQIKYIKHLYLSDHAVSKVGDSLETVIDALLSSKCVRRKKYIKKWASGYAHKKGYKKLGKLKWMPNPEIG